LTFSFSFTPAAISIRFFAGIASRHAFATLHTPHIFDIFALFIFATCRRSQLPHFFSSSLSEAIFGHFGFRQPAMPFALLRARDAPARRDALLSAARAPKLFIEFRAAADQLFSSIATLIRLLISRESH